MKPNKVFEFYLEKTEVSVYSPTGVVTNAVERHVVTKEVKSDSKSLNLLQQSYKDLKNMNGADFPWKFALSWALLGVDGKRNVFFRTDTVPHGLVIASSRVNAIDQVIEFKELMKARNTKTH